MIPFRRQNHKTVARAQARFPKHRCQQASKIFDTPGGEQFPVNSEPIIFLNKKID